MLKFVKGILRPQQSAAQSTVEKVATGLVGLMAGTALGTFLENRDRRQVVREVHEEADRRVREVEGELRAKGIVEEMSTNELFAALAARVREEQLRDRELDARRKIERALKKAVSGGNGKNDDKTIDCAYE